NRRFICNKMVFTILLKVQIYKCRAKYLILQYSRGVSLLSMHPPVRSKVRIRKSRLNKRILLIIQFHIMLQQKKSNELMVHTYSHLYNNPATGLRLFTVYGPKGCPDMDYFGFTDKFFKGEPIKIFNNGDFENDLYRDFTYI